MNKFLVMLSFALLVFSTSCGPKLIPGLDIELEDTPEHRLLLDILKDYRKAFENKDIDGLIKLTSKSFYETNGTTDTSDDYNYDGLRKHFTEHFKLTKQCSLSLKLKDVLIQENRATIDYRYTARYLMALPSGEKWEISDDINRLELVKEKIGWRILSGV